MCRIAQRLTKKVEITAGGRTWRILFTHRVLLDIEELTGRDAMRVNLAWPSATLLRAVLYAVLREAGAAFTLGETGALLRPGDTTEIRAALIDAWYASMPDPEPGDEREGQPDDVEPITTLDAWAEARYDLGLSDDEWLAMTPRMLRALSRRRLNAIRWREMMNGVLCAHTINHSFHAPKQATLPQSYMLHPLPEPERAPVYGETILGAFAA